MAWDCRITGGRWEDWVAVSGLVEGCSRYNPIGPDATDSGVALLIPIRNKKDEGECGN